VYYFAQVEGMIKSFPDRISAMIPSSGILMAYNYFVQSPPQQHASPSVVRQRRHLALR
jgi:hypothetical protein